GQSPPGVIAIIGDLVIKLLRRRVQLQHPIQAPFGFVEDVRDAVGAWLAESIELVHGLKRDKSSAFYVRTKSRFGTEFIGQEHLGGGVAGGEEVFEQIGSVVPSAARIHISAVRHRPKS